MKHGITPSFMAKPWGNVRLCFPAIIRISYAIMAIGQLPGCSGSVENRLIHLLPSADGMFALEATSTYLSRTVMATTSSPSNPKSYRKDV
jgi:hypothetical protein